MFSSHYLCFKLFKVTICLIHIIYSDCNWVSQWGYVCVYVSICMCICMYVLMYDYIYVLCVLTIHT